MINNFKQFEPLLNFFDKNDCYFIQLLKRQKDNPEMKRNMVNVDNFFVYSVEEYREMEPRIIEVSNLHNARAYIRVNRRNTEKLALTTLVKISNLILSKDYKAVKNAYLSAAGECNSEPMKRWIIDIDRIVPPHKWYDYVEDIKNAIKKLHDKINDVCITVPHTPYQILTELHTKNGIHLITHPFDVKAFSKELEKTDSPMPDIHKDNPTILYQP